MTEATADPVYDGFVEDLDETLYHSLPGLSSTGAKKILHSAAHYRDYIDHPEPRKKEFDLGSAVHSKVLGVGADYVAYPKELLGSNGAASTTAAKNWAAEQRENGLIVLKQNEVDTINRMVESVLTHPAAAQLLTGGVAEVSMFATDPLTGIALRGRLDYRRVNQLVDVKTTADDASESAFRTVVFRLGYDVQYGLYSLIYELITGEPAPPWLWIVVEKSRPFLTGVHVLGEDEKDMGRRKARRAIERYARALETDEWPGYQNSTGQNIGLVKAPMWAISEFVDEYEGHLP